MSAPESHGLRPTVTHDPAATHTLDGGVADPVIVRRLGDYELLHEIARGGMGIVFQARQVSLNRPVALKMILAGTYANAAAVQRFRTEAEAAANLDHPNILPIYDVGEQDGHQYFSMKLVGGATLASRVNELKAKPREAAALLATLARAVHFAHQRGILHRDLKPGNVLLDGDGTPFVADFGLAKKVDSDDGATRTGAVMGTPSYMAPEQARGDKGLTTAVDVYSLGAILFELLTGQPPFKSDSAFATIKKVIETEAPDPRSIHPAADRDLSLIALKCLQKEPSNRYATSGDLADDLDRWLTGEPIQARSTGRIERVSKLIRRNPAVSALSAVALAAIVAGAAFSIRYAILADRRANDAFRKQQELEQRDEENLNLLAVSEFERARALRLAGQPGWKKSALELLKRSEELTLRPRRAPGSGLAVPIEDIRGEIIAAHSRLDVRLLHEIPGSGRVHMLFSGDGNRCLEISSHSTWSKRDGSVADLKLIDLGGNCVLAERTDENRRQPVLEIATTAAVLDYRGDRLLDAVDDNLEVRSIPEFRLLAQLPRPLRKDGKPAIFFGGQFSPDGRWIAALLKGDNWQYCLYDLKNPGPQRVFATTAHVDSVAMTSGDNASKSMHFSTDSKLLALRALDGKRVTFHDPETGREIHAPFEGQEKIIEFRMMPNRDLMVLTDSGTAAQMTVFGFSDQSPVYSRGGFEKENLIGVRPDGRYYASTEASNPAAIIISDGQSHEDRERFFPVEGQRVTHVGWNKNRQLIIGTRLGISVWEIDEPLSAVASYSFSTSALVLGDRAASCLITSEPVSGNAFNQSIQAYDRATQTENWAAENPVGRVQFSPNDQQLSIHTAKAIVILNARDGLEERKLATPFSHAATNHANWINPKTICGFGVNNDNHWVYWNYSEGRPIRDLRLETDSTFKAMNEFWSSQCVSGDGKLYFFRPVRLSEVKNRADVPWRIFNAEIGEELRTIPGGADHVCYTAQLNYAGTRLLTCHVDARKPKFDNFSYWTVRDTATGDVILRVDNEYTGKGFASMSRDGKWVIVPGRNGNVHLWDVDRREMYAKWKPILEGNQVGNVNFLADGSIAIVPTRDENQIQVININLIRPLLPLFDGD